MTPCEPKVKSMRAVVSVGDARTLGSGRAGVRHRGYALEAAKRRPAWSVVSRGSDGGGPVRTLGRRV